MCEFLAKSGVRPQTRRVWSEALSHLKSHFLINFGKNCTTSPPASRTGEDLALAVVAHLLSERRHHALYEGLH